MKKSKFQVITILYAGCHVTGQDYKVHYKYCQHPRYLVTDVKVDYFRMPVSYYRNENAGIHRSPRFYQRFVKTYTTPRVYINKARISQQLRWLENPEVKKPRNSDYDEFIEQILPYIKAIPELEIEPLVGWAYKEGTYKFNGLNYPLFADISFNRQEPGDGNYKDPMLLWQLVPEILPTVAYALFAYTNYGQWTNPDGDFCKFIGHSNFNPPYTLTNIGICPKEDILLQYLYANPFASNLFATEEIPYCWPHTLLGFEADKNRMVGDMTYPVHNLVLQKQLSAISNDVLDQWNSKLLRYPCLYTHTSNLKYSRAEAALLGHIICQLPAKSYPPVTKQVLRKKIVKDTTRIWWYYIYKFISAIQDSLNTPQNTLYSFSSFVSPEKVLKNPSTPLDVKRMIHILKPYPAHLMLLMTFWAFQNYLQYKLNKGNADSAYSTKYAIARTKSLYKQLEASLLPLNSSLQLFCNYLRDIFVAQCVTPTYLHWEGVEHSGKENCYYLDAHAWFAEFEKYTEIKLNRTEVQGEISGLLKLRPNRPALGNYRTYEGEKRYVLCILKDKLPK